MKAKMEESIYLPEEENAIKELSERFGIHEPIAKDCVASRTRKEMNIVLTFLRRYGHMINVK